MAKIARKTKRYPSDLTDEEWERIAPLMPKPGRRGRPREIDFREVINAVRYLVRSGCGWRMLPVHFGHWRTVYGWFRELARRFLFQTIHDIELMLDRERQGREASPSAAVIDSQSVKAPHSETRGYDAGKKIVGRKRHIAVDTDGRLLMVNLTTADISAAMSIEGLLGTDDVFAADLQALRPHPGQALAAANMRAVLADSPIRDSHRDPEACTRVQDAYSLRCAPQVLGAAWDAIGSARGVVERDFPALQEGYHEQATL